MRKSLFILGDLREEDILLLAKLGQAHDVPPGDILIRAGENVEALYFVTAGKFSVEIDDATRVAELAVGDVVGEMSFVEKRPPDASVRALEPARVLAVPRPALLNALDASPAFSARFYKALATFLSDRLRVMTARAAGDEAQSASLDDHVLDVMHVAGDRMLRLIDLMEGRET